MKRVVHSYLFLFLGLVFSGSVMSANLITNGSFEQGTFTGGAWDTVFPGETVITGWDIGGAGVDWHNTVEMQFPQDGTYGVDLNLSGNGLSNTGTLSQTFSTEAGKSYELTFYLSGPDGQTPSFQNPREVRVDVAGTSQVFSTPASWHEALVWERHQFLFTATGPSTTVTFASTNGDYYWGPFLDNVSVNEQTVTAAAKSVPTLTLVGLLVLSLVTGVFGVRTMRRSN